MAHFQRETFGPGALESVTLVWSPVDYHRGHQGVSVQGWYSVYCGEGNEHVVRVRSRQTCLDCAGGEHYDRTDSYALAGELVNEELEDWFDPCDSMGY